MSTAMPSFRSSPSTMQDKRWADYNRAIRMALAEKEGVPASDDDAAVLKAIGVVGQTVAAKIADPQIVQHFCAALREAIGAEFAYVIGFDPDTHNCHTLGGDESDAAKRRDVFDARHSRDEILASFPELSRGGVEVEVASSAAALAEHYREAGFRRVLHVPLRRDTEIGGMLLVGCRASSQPFDDQARAIVHGSAASAALALEIDRTRRQLVRTEQLSRYLAANISHELRNTFSVIIGYGEILRDEARRAASLEGTNAAMVERLYTAACEGLEILRPAFELSNPLREQTPLEIEEVDVGALIDDLVAERFCHQRPEVGLSADTAPALPAARTDRMKLRMILEQVLSNAQKFTFTGEVTIVTRRNDDDRIEIAIADTGPGISSERLAAAFDALAGTNSEEAREPATGLGLYISKQLADKLGAIIDVESRLGQGTTVRITLPSRPPA